MIHIYTGPGKGKTSAALGTALRSLGWGRQVVIIQFLKNRPGGEERALEAFDNCVIHRFGRGVFLRPETIQPEDRRLAAAGLERARAVVEKQRADLLILDEINVALFFNLLSPGDILTLIDQAPPEIELILTGRKCPPEIIRRADYATRFEEVAHPGRRGVAARQGIEY